jgi:hypothetical protein
MTIQEFIKASDIARGDLALAWERLQSAEDELREARKHYNALYEGCGPSLIAARDALENLGVELP